MCVTCVTPFPSFQVKENTKIIRTSGKINMVTISPAISLVCSNVAYREVPTSLEVWMTKTVNLKHPNVNHVLFMRPALDKSRLEAIYNSTNLGDNILQLLKGNCSMKKIISRKTCNRYLEQGSC